jgi:lysophospholipase L1-like esterase
MPAIRFVAPLRKTLSRMSPIVMANEVDTSRRLDYHKIALEAMGVTDLSSLGKLPISGIVTPSCGLLVPRADGIISRQTTFSSVVRIKPGQGARARFLEKIGGVTDILKANAFPQAMSPTPRQPRPTQPIPLFALSTLPINVAYWAADWVEVAPDTQIILMQPNRWLVIIANRISFGANVSIGWEMVEKVRPGKPVKPRTPDPPPQSIYMAGTVGRNGTGGARGGPAPNGDHGAEIEIWTLDMTGTPEVVVAGQDGFKGGHGGDGGDGGKGAKGKNWTPNLGGLDCANGPGNGGDGGPGGRGGDGSVGGGGGNGGRFSLYAPQAVIDRYLSGFYIDATAGRGGEGGEPGLGGKGGEGGPPGNDRTGVLGGCPTSYGKWGKRGADGAQGTHGTKGPNGQHQPNPFKFQTIDKDAIVRALSKPAINALTPVEAIEGVTVTINGKRFTRTDTVTVDGVTCATTVSSDTLLTFIVGKVPGGRQKAIQVRQTDGTLSNKASMHILPTLKNAESGNGRSDSMPPARFRPSTWVTLVGTGFSPGSYVRVLDQHVTGGDVQYVDSHTLKFKLIRPASTPRNSAGEVVEIQVILADGTTSNSISIVLDTYRILVLGDSILWGQGLRDDLKFSAQVERFINVQQGNIGVYRDILAHSGAVIGVGNTNAPAALPGEVPAAHPTILQQISAFTGAKDTIDLILLDGGINDVGVEDIVGPTATSNLTDKTRQNCYHDMKVLLTTVTREFPAARVIVTGYYQIVSEDSDVTMLAMLLVGVGIPIVGLPTSVIAGGILTVAAKQIMIDRSKTFADRSQIEIQRAVQEVNATLASGSRVQFAQPSFGPRNAIFAPDAWIWGVDEDLSPADHENQGGVAPQRAQDCASVGSAAPIYCGIASIGHPNVKGANEYFRVIASLL